MYAHERSKPRPIAGTLLALLALASAGGARGASELVPELRIEAESNDNPRLVADVPGLEGAGDDRATRLLLDARLGYRRFGPRGELTLTPRLRSDAYADAGDRDLESTDVFLGLDGERRWERAAAGVGLELSRERILGAEFLTARPVDIDVEDVPAADAVLPGLNERRAQVVLSPYGELAVGARDSIRFSSRFMDVRYTSGTPTNRTDFQDSSLGLELVRDLQARSTLSGRIVGSRYEAEANRNQTDTIGVEIGFTRRLSDIWSLSLAWGLEQSDFRYIDAAAESVSGTDNNFTAGLGLRKRSERSSLNFDLRRRVTPDSFGFLVARNEIGLTLLRRVSQSVTGGIGLRSIESDGVGGVVGDRRYGRAELSLDWSFSELWSLVAGYQYTSWAVDSVQRDARSNSFSIGFNYRGRSRQSAL